MQVSLAEVEVTRQPIFFERRRIADDAALDRNELDLPSRTWRTMAVRLTFERCPEFLGADDSWAAAIHGFEHVAWALAPLIAECSRSDIGSNWTVSDKARIRVYDGTPGGVGISELLFEGAERWLRACAETVLRCKCEDGCPRCILSPYCMSPNEELAKGAVRTLAELILNPASAPR